LKIRDERKKIDIGIFFPIKNKSNISKLAWSLKPKKEILEKSKNMTFEEIRDEAINLYLKEKFKM